MRKRTKKLHVKITIRIPEQIDAGLERIMKKTGLSKAELIRDSIKKLLKEYGEWRQRS